LNGGVIASTQAAVDQGKNSFSTGGQLSISDLQNTASYNAESFQVSVGVGSMTGSSAGVGQDLGSATSTTQAGISGIAGNQAVRTGDAQRGIQKIFDANKVKNDIYAQVAITSSFGQQASKVVGDYAQKKLEEAKANNDQAGIAQWSEGGTARVALHTLVGGLALGGAGAAGSAASQIAGPELADQIKQLDIPLEVKQAIVQAAGMAIGAVAGGSAGAASAQNATANNFLSNPKLLERNKALAILRDDKSKSILSKLQSPVAGVQDAAGIVNALQYIDQRSDALLTMWRGDPTSLSPEKK
jgi:filamentous hemagglutinin